MPPLPTLRVPALAELARQLRFASPKAAAMHVERAESLLDRIDPGQAYPAEWLVFQITGVRSEQGTDAVAPGEAVLADLPAMIETLSVRAAFNADALRGAGWLSAEQVCKRWNVSQRTLQRYKRMGLVGRRASLGKARTGVVLYSPSAVERVERRDSARLQKAGAYTRRAKPAAPDDTDAPSDTRTRSASARLPGSINADRRRVLERAVRFGVPVALIARRWGRTQAAVLRALLVSQAQRLRAVPPAPGEDRFSASAFKPGSREAAALLSPPGVATGLGASCASDLIEHVATTVEAGRPDQQLEAARARAVGFLIARARHIASRIDPIRPTARLVDEARTDLLWAARIKAELVRSEQLLLLKTVEDRIGMPITDVPAPAASGLFALCVDAVAAGVDRFEVFRGGRLAAPVGIELNRVIARWLAGPGGRELAGLRERRSRQAARAAPPMILIADWTRRVSSWQSWIEPDARVRLAALGGRLRKQDAEVLIARFGWAGEPPRTIAQIGEQAGAAFNVAARLEREALRGALLVVRRA